MPCPPGIRPVRHRRSWWSSPVFQPSSGQPGGQTMGSVDDHLAGHAVFNRRSLNISRRLDHGPSPVIGLPMMHSRNQPRATGRTRAVARQRHGQAGPTARVRWRCPDQCPDANGPDWLQERLAHPLAFQKRPDWKDSPSPLAHVSLGTAAAVVPGGSPAGPVVGSVGGIVVGPGFRLAGGAEADPPISG